MLGIIIGVLGFIFLLVYVAFNIDPKKHYFLTIILISFAFFSLQFIPKIMIDFDILSGTTTIIFNVVIWLIRIFVAYLVLFFLYEAVFKKVLMKLGVKSA